MLKRALEQHQDFGEALDVARKMVAFVLHGSSEFPQEADGVAQTDVSPSDTSAQPASMHRINKRWTPQLDEQLRRMWVQGMLVTRIAAQLGRSEASINSRVRHLKLPKRRYPKTAKANGFSEALAASRA